MSLQKELKRLFNEKDYNNFFSFDNKEKNKSLKSKELYKFKSKNNQYENYDYFRYCNDCKLRGNKPLI